MAAIPKCILFPFSIVLFLAQINAGININNDDDDDDDEISNSNECLFGYLLEQQMTIMLSEQKQKQTHSLTV